MLTRSSAFAALVNLGYTSDIIIIIIIKSLTNSHMHTTYTRVNRYD